MTSNIILGVITSVTALSAAYSSFSSASAAAEANKVTRINTTVQMAMQQAQVAKCIMEVYHFKKSLGADEDNYDKIFAQLKNSNYEQVKDVDACRKLAHNFYYSLWMLKEMNVIEEKYMEELGYAQAGNFKALIEPLDKENLKFVNATANYSENRPVVYKWIEQAQKDPATKKYFN